MTPARERALEWAQSNAANDDLLATIEHALRQPDLTAAQWDRIAFTMGLSGALADQDIEQAIRAARPPTSPSGNPKAV